MEPYSGCYKLSLTLLILASAYANQDGPLLEEPSTAKPTSDQDESLLLNTDLPIFLAEPQNAFVVRNRPAILHCRAAHSLRVYFKCNGVKHIEYAQFEFVDPQTGVRIIEAEANVTRDMVEEFFGQEKFKCECYAWNGKGNIKSQSASVEVAYLKKQFEVYPESTTRVEIGHQMELKCMPPQGMPPPRVYWLRGDQVLQSDTAVLVTSEGHLLIGQARTQDTGNYTCIAENIAAKRAAPTSQIIVYSEKQRIDRGYDFTGVLEWFAERVDRIILLFDAHKLDISDEFRRSIEALRGHDDKIRIVLNKADMIDHQQLMRVYGALMWSLGKVLQMPEVVRVYIGSFWDRPLNCDVNRRLFEDETQDLFKDLQSLPRNSALRKLNDLIKRARLAKVHAYIISELKKEMPVFGKETKKKDLIVNLEKVYQKIRAEHSISLGDFPDLHRMQETLLKQDFAKFHTLKPKLLEIVDEMLSQDISQLMTLLANDTEEEVDVKGGAFDCVESTDSPFGYKRGEGVNAGFGEPEWIVNKERSVYDTIFNQLCPDGDKMSGAIAKAELVKSKLPNTVLSKIWKLADVDRDGYLDKDEFALAMHLINVKLGGNDIPLELPMHLLPPKQRSRLYTMN